MLKISKIFGIGLVGALAGCGSAYSTPPTAYYPSGQGAVGVQSYPSAPTSQQSQSLTNQSAASLAARACINYYTGQFQNNGFLQSYGFTQQGSRFVRNSSSLGLGGHTDKVTISMNGDECEYNFGSNQNATAAIQAFTNEFRAQGYQEFIVNSSRSQKTAFQIGNRQLKIYGSQGYAYSSFFTRITVSTR